MANEATQKQVVVKIDPDATDAVNLEADDFHGIWEPSAMPESFFAEADRATLNRLIARARQLDPSYKGFNPNEWAVLKVPSGLDPESVCEDLKALDETVLVHAEPPPVEPPAVQPNDDPLSYYQGYLGNDGINARYAWQFAGGDGRGQAFVDLEQGWYADHPTFNHPDLADHKVKGISGVNHSYEDHGTQVLGVVAAVDNSIGAIGVTPATASVRWVSEWRTETVHSRAAAILSAISSMGYGDVLLLETQCEVPHFGMLPVEVLPLSFELIRLATALGIVVVEAAAAKHTVNLDHLPVDSWTMILNRDHLGFRDSGAILVGASEAAPPYRKLPNSNLGNRVDCFAWGEEVATIDGSTGHGFGFHSSIGGTSASAAIVAGAALAVQGIYQWNLGRRLNSWQMRHLLGSLGTDPAEGKGVIGVMPDLRAIIEAEELGLPPLNSLHPA